MFLSNIAFHPVQTTQTQKQGRIQFYWWPSLIVFNKVWTIQIYMRVTKSLAVGTSGLLNFNTNCFERMFGHIRSWYNVGMIILQWWLWRYSERRSNPDLLWRARRWEGNGYWIRQYDDIRLDNMTRRYWIGQYENIGSDNMTRLDLTIWQDSAGKVVTAGWCHLDF